MDRHLTACALGALLVAGAAFGVHLGASTVEQMNPLYFQPLPVHPRERGAAVDPSQLPPPAPRFADYYGWEQGQAARLSDCQDCEALAARDSYSDLRYAVVETGWRPEPVAAYAPEAEAAPQEEAVEQAVPIEAYASFQIEEKPAAEEVVLASAEAGK